MQVVILGAPGAGKGTQAPLLAERLGIPIVATGDLFRAAVRDGTPLGIEARRYMDAGQLVPDDITVRLLLDRLGRPDADARRDPRRLPPDRRPGGRARRGARRRATRGVAARRPDRRPRGRADPPDVRSLGLPRGGPPVPRDLQPAPRAGRVRHRRLRAVPARRRPAGDDPRPDGAAARRAGRGHRPLPRPRASCARSTGSRTIDQVARRDRRRRRGRASPPTGRPTAPPAA